MHLSQKSQIGLTLHMAVTFKYKLNTKSHWKIKETEPLKPMLNPWLSQNNQALPWKQQHHINMYDEIKNLAI